MDKVSTDNKMIGKRVTISGMTLEIIAGEGDRWKTLNITTGETVFMDKALLEKAIKLGMAEQVE